MVIMPLVDRYGRPVKGVRISVMPSSRCNFNCIFCHHEGIHENPEVIMTPNEIERIVRILMRFGIDSVKLTGGEPMLRSDILEIVERLGRLGLRDLSMTTNGTRIPEFASELREKGLKRVNISLHSLNPKRYCWITGHREDVGEKVYRYTLEAIKASLDAGLNPIKLNVVVMRDVNDDEIDNFISFIEKLDSSGKVILQLIELIPLGPFKGEFYERYHYDLGEVEERFSKIAVKKIIRRLHLRHQYLLPNGVWVEFVRPVNNYVFCMNDNRIRITHDGKFKPCLMRNDNHVDFLNAMRSGASDEELEKLFLKAVYLREPYYKPPNIKPRPDISWSDH